MLTPKSLLRHPAVASTPRELAEGRFLSVIDDREARGEAKSIKRLVLCSGKVYVDLISSERAGRREGRGHLPRRAALSVSRHGASRGARRVSRRVRDVVWLQEEPENMGAWEFMRPLLEELIGDRCPLRYIGRARSASPSEGSAAWHQLNQKALVEQAFDLDSHASKRRWCCRSRSELRAL